MFGSFDTCRQQYDEARQELIALLLSLSRLTELESSVAIARIQITMQTETDQLLRKLKTKLYAWHQKYPYLARAQIRAGSRVDMLEVSQQLDREDFAFRKHDLDSLCECHDRLFFGSQHSPIMDLNKTFEDFTVSIFYVLK
eukprot:Gregarina_sp_Poly_1__3092@NODE_1870_length_3159_cov_41_316624_g390_i1_p3_GENE_NODE_1870_length_3159_cov_41_316624_g390_i1NODE_1870_length_3159_cov_41_316624_g390_i1_p3_ORF_typecomplete_len141_score6_66Endonuc_BglI/PF14562_6/0_088_NODE_1870_length_3159_cov_41_316624_g390_i113371759